MRTIYSHSSACGCSKALESQSAGGEVTGPPSLLKVSGPQFPTRSRTVGATGPREGPSGAWGGAEARGHQEGRWGQWEGWGSGGQGRHEAGGGPGPLGDREKGLHWTPGHGEGPLVFLSEVAWGWHRWPSRPMEAGPPQMGVGQPWTAAWTASSAQLTPLPRATPPAPCTQPVPLSEPRPNPVPHASGRRPEPAPGGAETGLLPAPAAGAPPGTRQTPRRRRGGRGARRDTGPALGRRSRCGERLCRQEGLARARRPCTFALDGVHPGGAV